MSLAVQPPDQVGVGESPIPLAEFRSKRDRYPRKTALTWPEWAERLTRYLTRHEKDGPGWSPTLYREKATRGKKGVELVTALALDFDHCEPPRDRLEGLAWIGHTTFSHTDDDPRWRVVIRLSRPVKAEDWPAVWTRAQQYFGATADEQCKDCSRFFYLPSCQPDSPHLAEQHEGKPLNIDDLPVVPEPPRPIRTGRRAAHAERDPYATAAFESELTTLAQAREGERNAQLNRSAFSLAQLVGGGSLDRTEVEQALEATALQIGLDETEVQRTIRSAMEAGLSQPRRVPVPSPMSVPLHIAARAEPVDVRDPVPIVRHLQDAVPPEPPDELSSSSDTDQSPEFHLTDLGNAQRLVAAHGIDLHYAHQHGRWFVWDGKHWAEDTTAEVERRAKRTVRAMFALAADEDLDADKAKTLVKHALRSESHKAIGAMVALARSEPGIPVTIEQLDRNPWLLNVNNGVLDLRTGQLRSHRREDLLTRLAPAAYVPEATCPTWLAFLDRIMDGNRHLIAFLQRAIGYTLTGITRERVTFFLHGTGANGKSTLVTTLDSLLGDYAETTRAETLMVKTYDTAIPNDIAALRGARLVSTSETEEGKRLAESLVKAITGGDTLSARFMRGEFFKFRPNFKLWLATNHKPVIRGSDQAIWDRIRLVPFNVRIADADQDKELPVKLRREIDGILAWAVRGCLDWQQNGLGTPQEVIAATESYRSEMDVLATFLIDCCVIADGAEVLVKDLYTDYEGWCRDNGEKPMSKKALGLRLQEKGFHPGRARGRAQERIWTGLGRVGFEHQTVFDADTSGFSTPNADASGPRGGGVPISNADASGMQTHADANPGITGLYEPHVGLSRKSRLHASAWQTRLQNDGRDEPAGELPDVAAPTCAGCNRPAGDGLGQLRKVSGHWLHDSCSVRAGSS